MKREALRLTNFLMFNVILLAGASNLYAQTIANGGFEEGEKTAPERWYPTYTDWIPETIEKVIFHWDNRISHGGQRSVSIEISEDFPPRLNVAYNWTIKAERWEVGGTYEVSVWVKTHKLMQPAFLLALCWDAGEKKMLGIANKTSPEVSGTRDWTLIKTRIKVPKNTEVLRIRIGTIAGTDPSMASDSPFGSRVNKGCKVWFDDIQIVKVSK